MADLAIPFSLSDILERVTPGGLLIAAVVEGFGSQILVHTQISSQPLGYAALLAGAYAVGVAVNSLTPYVPIKRYRRYWSASPSAMEAAVRTSVETHFGVAADDQAWRLCYGTVMKQGYGANTQLFLGLDVFCRAMTVASLLALFTFIAAAVIALLARAPVAFHLIFAAASLVLSFLFRRGASIYSQSFVASIYEGFFNWWCDEQSPHKDKDSVGENKASTGTS